MTMNHDRPCIIHPYSIPLSSSARTSNVHTWHTVLGVLIILSSWIWNPKHNYLKVKHELHVQWHRQRSLPILCTQCMNTMQCRRTTGRTLQLLTKMSHSNRLEQSPFAGLKNGWAPDYLLNNREKQSQNLIPIKTWRFSGDLTEFIHLCGDRKTTSNVFL